MRCEAGDDHVDREARVSLPKLIVGGIDGLCQLGKEPPVSAPVEVDLHMT